MIEVSSAILIGVQHKIPQKSEIDSTPCRWRYLPAMEHWRSIEKVIYNIELSLFIFI